MAEPTAVYLAIARSLRDFGYDGVSRNMIQEVHEAMQSGAELPHGVVGMFARKQLLEAEEEGLIERKPDA